MDSTGTNFAQQDFFRGPKIHAKWGPTALRFQLTFKPNLTKSVWCVWYNIVIVVGVPKFNRAMTSIYDVDEEPKNIVFRAFFIVVCDCILEDWSPTFFLLVESNGEGLCSL